MVNRVMTGKNAGVHKIYAFCEVFDTMLLKMT